MVVEQPGEAVSAYERPFLIMFLPISVIMTSAQHQELVGRRIINSARLHILDGS